MTLSTQNCPISLSSSLSREIKCLETALKVGLRSSEKCLSKAYCPISWAPLYFESHKIFSGYGKIMSMSRKHCPLQQLKQYKMNFINF